MDIYADSLEMALANNDHLTISSFIPESRFDFFSNNKNFLRFLRYVYYPMIVRSVEADIHHTIDHGYAHLLPKFTSGRTCISVHDLIPLLSWNGAIEIRDSNNEQQKFRKPYLNLYSLKYLNQYDQIIASSNSTKVDLVNYLEIDEAKIEVIPPIISSCFKRANDNEIKEFRIKYSLSTTCKWIVISGNSYYKNHISCLKVLKELNKHSRIPIKLIRTGLVSSEFQKQVDNLKLNDFVINMYLSKQTDLACLYSSIDCLLFPSLYEGFGMPVAEVLACGTPVVTSNRGSLNEVAGNLAPRLDPYDISGLTNAVYQALFETSIKEYALSNGPSWIAQFSEKVISQKINSVYNRLNTKTDF